MANELKKWGEEINQKKVDFTKASEAFKINRKLLKSFVKENVSFEEGKSSITPEILTFVLKAQTNFRFIGLGFIALVILISILSTYLLLTMTKSLNIIINDLKLRFDSLNGMSFNISDQSNGLSAATQEQTDSLQETVSTMKEITSTIENNFTLSTSSKEEVIENSKLTKQGTNYINEMLVAVDNVKSVSEQLPKDMVSISKR